MKLSLIIAITFLSIAPAYSSKICDNFEDFVPSSHLHLYQQMFDDQQKTVQRLFYHDMGNICFEFDPNFVAKRKSQLYMVIWGEEQLIELPFLTFIQEKVANSCDFVKKNLKIFI